MGSLYNKYRPQSYKDICGHKNIIKILKRLIIDKKYNIPILLTGTYGLGKTTLARIYAKSILCENFKEEPCDNCSNCKLFNGGSHPNFLEIDAASNASVTDIRQLKEDSQYAPLSNHASKILIIDESHSISKQGNEAFLKQLEDNSFNQVYIFCTTSPESMLSTVRSRCLELPLRDITKEEAKDFYKKVISLENINCEEKALNLLIEKTHPHMRDGLKLIECLSYLGDISLENTKTYFNIINDETLDNLLIYLKSDIQKALAEVSLLLEGNSCASIYENIIKRCISAFKFKKGIINNEQDIPCYNLSDLTTILDILTQRTKESVQDTLYADIILINDKLTDIILNKEPNNSGSNLNNKIVFKNKTVSDAQIASDFCEPKKEKIEEISPEEIQKMYKGYNVKLATMFFKSKHSSGYNVTTRTKVEDVKKEVSRLELKSYLNKK